MSTFIKAWPAFKEGAYAVVFFSSDGRATKVFRQRSDASREHVEKVFNSEIQAYEIAQGNQNLFPLVPRYFGRVEVKVVKDAQGQDISSQFHLDLAYEMEKIDGQFVKIGSLNRQSASEVCHLFCSAGIRHICDASVIEAGGKIDKVIDFAIEEHVLEHKPH